MGETFQQYQPSKEFLVCVDSDGCAMDTMEVKHRKCFATQLIQTWELYPREEAVRELWYRINLYSATRGINRFKGLVMTFEQLAGEGFPVEGLDSLSRWAADAPALSNPALEAEAARTGSSALQKALDWSNGVNRLIAALPGDDQPYEGVALGLSTLCAQADIAVVSSANGGALQEEWQRHGLTAHIRLLLGQEAGTKAACIRQLAQKGYPKGNILMVGDAPGDLDAARQNNVWFYPILVGKEAFSWNRLREEAFPRLLAGTFTTDYQQTLVGEFETTLGI